MNVHTAFATLESLVNSNGNPANRRALSTLHAQMDTMARQRLAFLELLAGLGVPDPAAYLAHEPSTLRELGRCIFEKATGATPETIRADERLHGAFGRGLDLATGADRLVIHEAGGNCPAPRRAVLRVVDRGLDE